MLWHSAKSHGDKFSNSKFIHSQLQKQLCEMSSRLDNLEGSLRKDIHTILDILHRQHQQQHQQPTASHSHYSSQHSAAGAVRWAKLGHISERKYQLIVFYLQSGNRCHISRPNRATSHSIIWVQASTRCVSSSRTRCRPKCHIVSSIHSCNRREMFSDPYRSPSVQQQMKRVCRGKHYLRFMIFHVIILAQHQFSLSSVDAQSSRHSTSRWTMQTMETGTFLRPLRSWSRSMRSTKYEKVHFDKQISLSCGIFYNSVITSFSSFFNHVD